VSKVGYGEPTRFASGHLCAPVIRADTFSARLNYFTAATVRFPTLFGFRTSPTVSIYSERRGEYQAYLRTTVVGGEASVTRDLGRGLPLRLAYSLEYGRTEAPPALLCALFNRCDSQSRALITDTLLGMEVLGAALARLPDDVTVLALPPTTFGKSVEHITFPGTLTFSGDTLRLVLRDLAASVARSGFTKLVLLGSHGGNVGTTDDYFRDLRMETDLRVFKIFLGGIGNVRGAALGGFLIGLVASVSDLGFAAIFPALRKTPVLSALAGLDQKWTLVIVFGLLIVILVGAAVVAAAGVWALLGRIRPSRATALAG